MNKKTTKVVNLNRIANFSEFKNKVERYEKRIKMMIGKKGY